MDLLDKYMERVEVFYASPIAYHKQEDLTNLPVPEFSTVGYLYDVTDERVILVGTQGDGFSDVLIIPAVCLKRMVYLEEKVRSHG